MDWNIETRGQFPQPICSWKWHLNLSEWGGEPPAMALFQIFWIVLAAKICFATSYKPQTSEISSKVRHKFFYQKHWPLAPPPINTDRNSPFSQFSGEGCSGRGSWQYEHSPRSKWEEGECVENYGDKRWDSDEFFPREGYDVLPWWLYIISPRGMKYLLEGYKIS